MTHPNLIERLKQLRVILKSGDYDGADLMSAWCAMMDAVDALEADGSRISTLTAEVEELRALLTDVSGLIRVGGVTHKEMTNARSRIATLTKGEGDKP